METQPNPNLQRQNTPLAMEPEEFRQAGHDLVNRIADFLRTLPQKPVTSGERPKEIRSVLGSSGLPAEGAFASDIIQEATDLLFNHSLFNGHPRFWGYITSSATPIGALGDMLAAAVNPNVGAYALSPMATEVERQTIQWIAEFIGYPISCGGLFVSGGNMANFIGLLAARRAKAGWDIRKEGIQAYDRPFTVYCSKGTHTWVQKAVDLFGFGTDAIRWIEVDENQQLDLALLERQIASDQAQGCQPLVVIGNAGSVSTGTVDPLAGISSVCRKSNLWFHVDGACGAPAAGLPESSALFKGLEEADSVALDPHKWFYSPLEAGCILVRDPQHLQDAFSFHPDYYHFDGSGEDKPVNYFDYGMQNSRGFRALKVWMAFKQAGRNGYLNLIRGDIALSQHLFSLVQNQPELEAVSQSLSITTFRYVPQDLTGNPDEPYLNRLNEALLDQLQAGGEVFLSNAVINEKYCLRACIVNFRTQPSDIEALTEIVLRQGKLVDAQLREQLTV
jgi:aromatic-L-amino-acid decarboxylase